MPRLASNTLSRRYISSCSTVLYWTIGPAISWGNSVTYAPTLRMFFWGLTMPRYTAMV